MEVGRPNNLKVSLLSFSSVFGASKDTADTQRVLQSSVPSLATEKGEKAPYRCRYAVHRLLKNSDASKEKTNVGEVWEESEVIGLVGLKPEATVPINDELTVKNGPDVGVLRVELGYLYLPTTWSSGYATEASIAVLDAARRATSFWAPYHKIYVEAIVSPDNPASCRVLEKSELKKIGVNEWDGEPVFLAGAWREPRVLVYGTWLIDK